MTPEVPGYDTCRENAEIDGRCQTLKPVHTQIGEGYACEVCQMTYIRVDKGAYIPFDQAMRLWVEKQKRAAARKARANQRLVGKPPKQKKRKKRYR